jgi:hypothetical protein
LKHLSCNPTEVAKKRAQRLLAVVEVGKAGHRCMRTEQQPTLCTLFSTTEVCSTLVDRLRLIYILHIFLGLF